VQDSDIEYIKNHIRNRLYMGDIERDKIRKLHTSEFFTPFEKVQERLNAYDISVWQDPTSQFIDPTCGDGQFIGEALIRKVENSVDFETALSTIYGVDLMQDNVKLCRERLLCGREDLRHIVEQNIVCADGLRYHYRFDGSHPYDDERKQQEFEERLAKFVDFG
jgi:type I restriction-modification system DNA methylase subunit